MQPDRAAEREDRDRAKSEAKHAREAIETPPVRQSTEVRINPNLGGEKLSSSVCLTIRIYTSKRNWHCALGAQPRCESKHRRTRRFRVDQSLPSPDRYIDIVREYSSDR